MIANSMEQLEKMLLSEMKDAMSEMSSKALVNMKEATAWFYNGASPRTYERTYALRDTPKVTSMQESGKELSFGAYLALGHQYSTGADPIMQQVLDLANYGIPFSTGNGHVALPTVGNMGFWEKAEDKMEKNFNAIMKRHFK